MSDLKKEAPGSAGSRNEPYSGPGSKTSQAGADAPRDYAKEYASEWSQEETQSQSRQSSEPRSQGSGAAGAGGSVGADLTGSNSGSTTIGARPTSASSGGPGRTEPGGTAGSGDSGETIERTRQQATRLMTDAKQKGQSMIDEKKHLAADEISSMANVLRKTAENLNQEDQVTTGHYAEQAAAGLDRLSTTLRDRDITTLFSQAESFARRSPGLFFGGAVAAGFFFSRFVKSTGERSESDYYGGSGRSDSGFSRGQSHDSSTWESRDTGARAGYVEGAEAGPGDRSGSSAAASHGDASGDNAPDSTLSSGKPVVPMPRSSADMSRNTDPDSPYGADSRSLPHTDKRSGGPNAN